MASYRVYYDQPTKIHGVPGQIYYITMTADSGVTSQGMYFVAFDQSKDAILNNALTVFNQYASPRSTELRK